MSAGGKSVARLGIVLCVVLCPGCFVDSHFKVRGEVRRAVSVRDGTVTYEAVPAARVTAYHIDKDDATGPVLERLPDERVEIGTVTSGKRGEFEIGALCGFFWGPHPVALLAERDGERSRLHVVWIHGNTEPTVDIDIVTRE